MKFNNPNDAIAAVSPKRAVVKGNKKNGIQFEVLGPMEAMKEAAEVAETFLGALPDTGAILDDQQKLFLKSYYMSLFDIPKSIQLAILLYSC